VVFEDEDERMTSLSLLPLGSKSEPPLPVFPFFVPSAAFVGPWRDKLRRIDRSIYTRRRGGPEGI
jgi:hypothetical protein